MTFIIILYYTYLTGRRDVVYLDSSKHDQHRPQLHLGWQRTGEWDYTECVDLILLVSVMF
jgi:hypothetical protein